MEKFDEYNKSYTHRKKREDKFAPKAMEEMKHYELLIKVFLLTYWFGLLFMIIIALVNIYSPENNVKDSTMDQDELEEYEEYFSEPTTPLREGFDIFSYKGKVYSLPSSYTEIIKIGDISDEEFKEMDLFPIEYEGVFELREKDGTENFIITISNHYDEEVPLSKCSVDSFYIINPAYYNKEKKTPDLEFCDGLTFDSTFEDLEKYLGAPNYHSHRTSTSSYYWDTYVWEYQGIDEYHCVHVSFGKGRIYEICIEKRYIKN